MPPQRTQGTPKQRLVSETRIGKVTDLHCHSELSTVQLTRAPVTASIMITACIANNSSKATVPAAGAARKEHRLDRIQRLLNAFLDLLHVDVGSSIGIGMCHPARP